ACSPPPTPTKESPNGTGNVPPASNEHGARHEARGATRIRHAASWPRVPTHFVPRASGLVPMNWEIVIGLETHAQLTTASKIFSGAPTAFGAAPNSQASAVDIALPGVLPVLNKGAVERAIRFG